MSFYEFISWQRLIINNSYLAKGEQGGLLVDSWTHEQEVVRSKSTNQHGLKESWRTKGPAPQGRLEEQNMIHLEIIDF